VTTVQLPSKNMTAKSIKSITSFFLGKPRRLGCPLVGIVVITTAALTGLITGDLKRCLWFSLAPLPGLVLADQWRAHQLHHQQCQWHSSLGETIHHQEARLLELEHYEGQLNQAIAVAQQVNEGLQSDNQSLKSERFLLGQQIAILKQRRTTLTDQTAELVDQIQDLESHLTYLHHEYDQFQIEVAEDLTPSGLS